MTLELANSEVNEPPWADATRYSSRINLVRGMLQNIRQVWWKLYATFFTESSATRSAKSVNNHPAVPKLAADEVKPSCLSSSSFARLIAAMNFLWAKLLIFIRSPENPTFGCIVSFERLRLFSRDIVDGECGVILSAQLSY